MYAGKQFANISVFWLLVFASQNTAAGILPVSGIVKDSDSGGGLTDARVAVTWYGTFGIGHGTTGCYAASTTTTGMGGVYLLTGGQLPGPIGPFDSEPAIFVYKAGYYRPDSTDRNMDKDDLVKFAGSDAERFTYLNKLWNDINCYGHNSSLLSLFRAIYQEARELAFQDSQQSPLTDMCRDIARIEVTDDRDPSGKDARRKIANYIIGHSPECVSGADLDIAVEGENPGRVRELLEQTVTV